MGHMFPTGLIQSEQTLNQAEIICEMRLSISGLQSVCVCVPLRLVVGNTGESSKGLMPLGLPCHCVGRVDLWDQQTGQCGIAQTYCTQCALRPSTPHQEPLSM